MASCESCILFSYFSASAETRGLDSSLRREGMFVGDTPIGTMVSEGQLWLIAFLRYFAAEKARNNSDVLMLVGFQIHRKPANVLGGRRSRRELMQPSPIVFTMKLPMPVTANHDHVVFRAELSNLVSFMFPVVIGMIVFLVLPIWTNNRRGGEQDLEGRVGSENSFLEPSLLLRSPDRLVWPVRHIIRAPIVAALNKPEFEVLAPATTTVVRMPHGDLLPKNRKPSHPREITRLVARDAVIGNGVMVVLYEEAGHLLMEIDDVRASVPAVPMKAGQVWSECIDVPTGASLVVIDDVAHVSEERGIEIQHLVVDLETRCPFVSSDPALTGRNDKTKWFARTGA